LGRDVRFYNENREKLDNKYPFERAEKFLRDIKKLGTTEDKLSYLDKFRILVTEIGKEKLHHIIFFLLKESETTNGKKQTVDIVMISE
jgi:hypothetical protein